MINKQTTLDLNGPNISFAQQPQSITINNSGSAQFVGIVTATFPVQTPPNPATGTGSLTYRWYESSFGALNDGANSTLGATISGSGTTTLSITSAIKTNLRFYVIADYVPSAYSQPSGAVVTVGTARSTGNATNEPALSNTAILTVRPLISVVTNPTSASVTLNARANFSALGVSNDGTSVSYRWQLNNNDISDSGNISGSNTPNLSISLPNETNNTVRARISHPTASNSPIFTNSANFTVVQPRRLLNFERMNTNGQLSFYSHDLRAGSYVQNGESAVDIAALNLFNVVYSPERDVNVRITLAGGAATPVQFGTPASFCGQGGVSTFDYTFEKNVEYVFYLATSYPSLTGLYYPGVYLGCWSGGGFSSSLYRKSRLVAVCGGGGGAGNRQRYSFGAGVEYKRGGSGGGVNVSGQSGESAFNITAPGGTAPAPGTFLTGRADFPFGSSINSCSNGVRVINSTGVPACSDFPGLTQLIVVRSLQGSPQYSYNEPSTTSFIASNSASISRGHKLGFPWGYKFNGPGVSGRSGQFTDLGAGAGANPGTSGGSFHTNGVPASGGGSGYHNGSISVVSTQLGGNPNPAGYIIIQLRE
jgi:hypothetical protein